MEIPAYPEFNVVSALLKSLIVSSDYMTTADQHEVFAPYLTLKSNQGKNFVEWMLDSIEWPFVDTETLDTVKPEGISEVKVIINDWY